jgi:hypothetical protein
LDLEPRAFSRSSGSRTLWAHKRAGTSTAMPVQMAIDNKPDT